MKLCVRRTFFDETAERSSAVQRSHSSPPYGTSLPADAAHNGYDNYVAELQSKAANLNASQFHVQPSKISKLKHCRQESSLSDVSTSISVSSDSESSDHETNSMPGFRDQIVDGNGGDYQVSWLDEDDIRQTAAQQNHTVAKMLLLSKALEDDVQEPSVSACKSDLETKIPGNWGHPDLCGRPCIFFAKGECANGDSCGFCHLHHRKVPHLDKRGRALLKTMTPEQRASLIAPLIMRKAVGMQLEEQASKMLKEMLHTNALGFTTVSKNGLAGIRKSMETMSMRQLLLMALSGDDDAEGLQIITKHIDHMRLAMKDSCRSSNQ